LPICRINPTINDFTTIQWPSPLNQRPTLTTGEITMKRFIICLFLTLIQTTAWAGQTIFSPDEGVLCDRKSGFCADSEGVSMAYTEQFLGKKAAAKLLKIMGTDSDQSSFTMSNGMHCETRERNCTVSKINNSPDPVGNITLFGKK
jgi:hypothetical protein